MGDRYQFVNSSKRQESQQLFRSLPGNPWSRLSALALLIWPLLVTAAPPEVAGLDSLSLTRALDIAIERNPDITLSAIAVRAAEAAVLTADVSPNPALSLQAQSINPRQGIGPGSLRDKQIDTTVRLDQLIERGGKRQYRTENASQMATASRSDLQEARRQLRLSVATAYYDLLAAQERMAITRETASLFQSTLDAAQKRKAAGDLAGSEVERLRVDVLRARNDARQAQADLTRSRLALLLMLGISAAPDEISAADAWPAPQAGARPTDVDALLARRPDVQAASARVQAAQAGLRLAQASRTRDVSVGVQADRSPASPMNGYYSSNSFGVSVQVPLFTSNYFEGDIRNALAGVDSAQENLHKVRRQASFELQRAYNDMQSAQERVARFRDELSQAAGRAVEAAEFAFRNGAISVTDVLDARRTFRAITIDELSARADYAKALSAWRAATLEDSSK